MRLEFRGNRVASQSEQVLWTDRCAELCGHLSAGFSVDRAPGDFCGQSGLGIGGPKDQFRYADCSRVAVYLSFEFLDS